jgi:hypothetical protein
LTNGPLLAQWNAAWTRVPLHGCHASESHHHAEITHVLTRHSAERPHLPSTASP